MFKFLTRYNLLLIIVILLYYIIIFSDLLSKGGSLAIIFSIAGWILVPLSLLSFHTIFLERFDNRLINVVYSFVAIFGFYIILFTIEERVGTFGIFYNENCAPHIWNSC